MCHFSRGAVGPCLTLELHLQISNQRFPTRLKSVKGKKEERIKNIDLKVPHLQRARWHFALWMSHEAERFAIWLHWLISGQTVKISAREQRNEKMRAVVEWSSQLEWVKTSPNKRVTSTSGGEGGGQFLSRHRQRSTAPAVLPLQEGEAAGTLSSVCQKESVRDTPSWFHSGGHKSVFCTASTWNMQEASLQSDDVFMRGRLQSLIRQLTQGGASTEARAS